MEGWIALGVIVWVVTILFVIPLISRLAIAVFVPNSIWIPMFRYCRVTGDKVIVTAPILFGRGYIFDKNKQLVTIRRRLVGITISKIEVPFSRINALAVTRVWKEGSPATYSYGMHYAGTPGGYFFELVMTVAGNGEFKIEKPDMFADWERRGRAERVEEAIRRLTEKPRLSKDHQISGTEFDEELYLLSRIGMGIRQRVSDEPGISHTALSGSVEGTRTMKESVIRQLLDEGKLRCERKDKVRRYFVQ